MAGSPHFDPRFLPVGATLLGLLFLAGAALPRAQASPRSDRGLVLLYDFSSADRLIRDRSGHEQPLHLRIGDRSTLAPASGGLLVKQRTQLATSQPATRLSDALRKSNAVTLEVWIKTADLSQKGPARILTLSKNSSLRNFTLGQDGDQWVVRLRTTKTSTNGIPSLDSRRQSVSRDLTHLVYTRDRSGQARLFLNGKQNATQKLAGTLANWDSSYRLALANELSGDRPWKGTFRLVAIYDRALTDHEVLGHFRAGPNAGSRPSLPAPPKANPNQVLFESKVAPLLARRCLDCHDPSAKEGGLDLTRHTMALRGGKSGPALVPGDLSKSQLWSSVFHDEMPEDGEPLSPEEKSLLRKWIEGGASWTIPVLDPADYLHGTKVTQSFIRRLTRREYIETVRATFGIELSAEDQERLPPDLRADGFRNTAYNLNVDFGHVNAYAELASIIASQVDAGAFARRFSRARSVADDKGMKSLIESMGRWILRAPLTKEEVFAFRGLQTTVASAGGNFEEGIRYVLEAMMHSPRFLYRMERQDDDGLPLPPNDYELISRLSYIAWGAPPDEELHRQAEHASLDRQTLESQVGRLLQDSRARDQSALFVTEWLDLNRLEHLQPNPEKFPHWSPELAADMREETLTYFKEIVWNQQRPLSDLFNTQIAFASSRLAQHYGLPPQEDERRYDLTSIPGRGGILTQASVLTMGGDEASMVTRGLFVLQDLLRGVVKAPPPGLDTTPVPASPGLSHRGIAEKRIADRSCGGCHDKFEPLAFGLEKFDGIGAYHEVDEFGNQLREDGKILFPGKAEPVPYESIGELMDLLAASDRVRETLTWKLTQFALGRPLTAADGKIVTRIHQEGWKNGGTYVSLMRAILLSDLVSPGIYQPHPPIP